VFKAGDGVGIVTKAGLPIGVGEPAINPVPRQLMTDVVKDQALRYGFKPNVDIIISIPNGAEITLNTWNGRLGIVGGLSILGTTGIVRPFSCAAWIASIHRGVDVARANNIPHVAGCTGATSEKVVQELYGLADHAMLDMGDFSGGLLKYAAKNPVPRITIGGGIGKMVKLAQGAVDLHSSRSQVDFEKLNAWSGVDIRDANTALEAVERAGDDLAVRVAYEARLNIIKSLKGAKTVVDTVVIDRAGRILGRSK
jgi:cobalt-precorrin-5B (C1)-methyltransferase